MKEIVKSDVSSDVSLLFATTGHLKDLLHQKDSGPVSYSVLYVVDLVPYSL